METNKLTRLLTVAILFALTAAASGTQQLSAQVEGTSQDTNSPASSAPPEMAQAPPKAPRVTCKNDQLTISADNSTLRSILASVQTCAGIQIDIPESTAGSRIFEELGPGPVRQVLASLLNGSSFDYVIGSSEASPQKVETVLLMARSKDTTARPEVADRPMTASRRAWMQTRQNRAASLNVDESTMAIDDSSSPAADEAAAAPAEAPATTASTATPAADSAPPADAAAAIAPAAGSMVGPLSTSPAQSASLANPSLDSGKSTAERISDMQQLFQQRSQLNQTQRQTSSPQ